MGFMDKVKAQADVAMAKAHEGMAQGQAKIDEVQTNRVSGDLFRALGQAVYAAQRQGGDQAAVAAAMKALDDFHAGRSTPTGTPPAAPPPGTPPVGGMPGVPVSDIPSPPPMPDIPVGGSPLAGSSMPPPPTA